MLDVAGHPAAQRAVADDFAAATEARSEKQDATAVGAEGRLAGAIDRALAHLLSLQNEDGHWCGELEGDSILESEYVMLLWFLGQRDDQRIEQACRTLRATQLSEGGWAIYPGGPADPSASVKAYFVLKLFGDAPEDEHMQRACAVIRSLGGVANTNSFTKIYLAIFQQLRWSAVPAVPPELILAPRWLLLNLAVMSAWSRASVVPLAMIWALKPRCEVPVRIDELVTGEPAERKGESVRERFWFAFFRGVDRVIKVAERLHLFAPVRKRALAECERWTLERLDQSAGLAAIFPAIANAAVALFESGHDLDQGPLASQLEELRKLELLKQGKDGEQGERLVLQPCCSPVWDTALSMAACLDAGVEPSTEEMGRASRWLLGREVKVAGDWQAKCPQVEPAGWYFEYANEFYPDCDDTAEVLTVLQRMARVQPRPSQLQPHGPQPERLRAGALEAALERGTRWLLAMQNRDGGWGAFDRGCDRELLTFVPFADHNAMIDPSTTDVSARAVEAVVDRFGRQHPAARRGADFIETLQESDGSWYGRWGCNYLYGTWLAVSALSRVGRVDGVACQRGVEWLLSVQLESGGWGETLETYADPGVKGTGPASAAQTGWAMMGLMAALRWQDAPPKKTAFENPGRTGRTETTGKTDNETIVAAVRRGAEFLLDQQREDGAWCDLQWTGTGFPQVFYLRYHYYDRYFPLQALAMFRAEVAAHDGLQ